VYIESYILDFVKKNASPYEHMLRDKECRHTLTFSLKDCAARHSKHWGTKIQYFLLRTLASALQ